MTNEDIDAKIAASIATMHVNAAVMRATPEYRKYMTAMAASEIKPRHVSAPTLMVGALARIKAFFS